MRCRFAFAAATLLLAVPAFAQPEPPPDEPRKEPTIRYKEHEVIDFEKPIDIDVPIKKPVGIFLTGRGDTAFPSQIEERVHFKRELAKTVGKNAKIAVSEVK